MNGRKVLPLLMSILLVLALFAGCGASDNSGAAMDREDYYMESGVESPMDPGAGIYDTVSKAEDVKITEQKLIKTVDISTETEDMEQLLSQLDQQVSALGGYVEKREVRNGSTYSGSYQRRYANLTIRIPVENLNQMVSHVQGSTNVTNYNESVDDVTTAYVDTESRMKALQVEQTRLLELLEKADTMADLLTIEQRLTEVRYSLESITSQLRTYDNKIAYSTVYLSISEVREYTPVAEKTFWQRISSGFVNSLKGLWKGIQNFVVFILVASPYLVFLGLLGLGIAAIIRAARKNCRKKKAQTREVGHPEGDNLP